MALGTELLVILLLTLVNGFFAAAEIGVLSVRRSRLRELAVEGKKAAAVALGLRDDPERFLATVQVGITVVGATAGAFGGATLEAPLTHWLEGLGFGQASDEFALALVVAFVSALSIVLGELVPKSLALRSSERTSLAVAPALAVLSRITKPVIWLLTKASNLVLRPFRDQTTFAEARLSPDELQSLVEEASTAGSLPPSVGDVASRAIELAELTVSSLLIPRTQVTFLSLHATPGQLWATLRNHPHSRYPVVRHDLDRVEGYVVARELVASFVEEKTIDLRSLMREVPFFVDRTPAITALRKLQALHTRLAMVVDERGMTAGIVTIGDISEAVLGEVLDEHEPPDDTIRVESTETALVRADAPVQEVNRRLGIDLPVSPQYATLSGLLMHASSRLMRQGEHLRVDGVEFEIVEATPRQVKLLRLRRVGEFPEPKRPASPS